MEDELERILWLEEAGAAAKAVADATFYARTQVRQGHNNENYKKLHNEHIKDALNELVGTVHQKTPVCELASIQGQYDDLANKQAGKHKPTRKFLLSLIGPDHGGEPPPLMEVVEKVVEFIQDQTRKLDELEGVYKELRRAEDDLKTCWQVHNDLTKQITKLKSQLEDQSEATARLQGVLPRAPGPPPGDGSGAQARTSRTSSTPPTSSTLEAKRREAAKLAAELEGSK